MFILSGKERLTMNLLDASEDQIRDPAQHLDEHFPGNSYNQTERKKTFMTL